MAKGWKLVGTNALEFGDTRTREEKRRDAAKQARAFDKAIRTTKRLTYEQLVEAADKRYEAKRAEDAALLQAFNDKKLKSKALIKRAQALKKKVKKDTNVAAIAAV